MKEPEEHLSRAEVIDPAELCGHDQVRRRNSHASSTKTSGDEKIYQIVASPKAESGGPAS